MLQGVFVLVIGDVNLKTGQFRARFFMALGGAAGCRDIFLVAGRCRGVLTLDEVHALTLDHVAVHAVRRLLGAKTNRLPVKGFLVGSDHIVKIVPLLEPFVSVAPGTDTYNFRWLAHLLQT